MKGKQTPSKPPKFPWGDRLMDMPTLFGKPLGDCTFDEVQKMANILQELAKMRPA